MTDTPAQHNSALLRQLFSHSWLGSNENYVAHVSYQDIFSLEKALATYDVIPEISYREAAAFRITADDVEKIKASEAMAQLATRTADIRSSLNRILGQSWYPTASGGYGAYVQPIAAKPIIDALSDHKIEPKITEESAGTFIELSNTHLQMIRNLSMGDRVELSRLAQQVSGIAQC